jgi:ferredoxin--NADP+ reductase
MGWKVVRKKQLGPVIYRLEVMAPEVSRKHKPGQFVVLRVNETGERIPLTVADKNPEKGTITLIFQVVGKTTMLLRDLPEGGEIQDIVGPLGTPTHVEKFGTVVCVCGGIGTGVLYPIARALKEAGNKVISIVGAQSANLLILEEEMGAISDELHISTDDGSKGTHGFVTDVLKKILDSGEKVNLIIAVGPLPMMKAVANVTRPYKIKTIVSLNSIMIDGTGMCGGCRVVVGGERKFTCVDGPEFDGHEVDFDNLAQRLRTYKEQEDIAREAYRSSEHSPGDAK